LCGDKVRKLIVFLILTACSTPKPAFKLKEWKQPYRPQCVLNVQQTNLPFEIGLTLLNTNLPTRYDGFSSTQPVIIKKDGTVINLGEAIKELPYQTTTIISSWADSDHVYVNKIWEDPQNAMLEETLGQLLFSAAAYRADVIKVNTITGAATTLTKVEEVSFYNVGTSKIPNSSKIAFSAMINGALRGYSMNEDGTDKQPVQSTPGNTYGVQKSPDGSKYVFHADYRLFIGDSQTGVEHQVHTGCTFNFFPVWSDDSQNIAFFCGASNISPDIYVVDRLGNNLRFIANRGGYSGSVSVIDGTDFHGGGSDFIAWRDSKIVYAAAANGGTELFETDVFTHVTRRLTFSAPYTYNYYPVLSDGKNYMLFNTNYSNLRNVNYLDVNTLEAKKVTNVEPGCGVYNIIWKPL